MSRTAAAPPRDGSDCTAPRIPERNPLDALRRLLVVIQARRQRGERLLRLQALQRGTLLSVMPVSARRSAASRAHPRPGIVCLERVGRASAMSPSIAGELGLELGRERTSRAWRASPPAAYISRSVPSMPPRLFSGVAPRPLRRRVFAAVSIFVRSVSCSVLSRSISMFVRVQRGRPARCSSCQLRRRSDSEVVATAAVVVACLRSSCRSRSFALRLTLRRQPPLASATFLRCSRMSTSRSWTRSLRFW